MTDRCQWLRLSDHPRDVLGLRVSEYLSDEELDELRDAINLIRQKLNVNAVTALKMLTDRE